MCCWVLWGGGSSDRTTGPRNPPARLLVTPAAPPRHGRQASRSAARFRAACPLHPPALPPQPGRASEVRHSWSCNRHMKDGASARPLALPRPASHARTAGVFATRSTQRRPLDIPAYPRTLCLAPVRRRGLTSTMLDIGCVSSNADRVDSTPSSHSPRLTRAHAPPISLAPGRWHAMVS